MHDDDPGDVVHDLFAEALYGDHPLGRPVIGTVESIDGLTRDAIDGFYRDRYTPDRMVVSVAGGVDHDVAVRLVEEAFAGPARRAGDPGGAPSPRTGGPQGLADVVVEDRPGEQANVLLGTTGLSRDDPRRWALAVLNGALGGGMSSRLFQSIREERGLAYSVYSYAASVADSGQFGVYAGCAPGKLDEVVGLVREELAAVAAHGLTDEEVARSKGQLRGSTVLGLEDTGSRMSRIGKAELVDGELPAVDDVLARIAAVTPDDVRAVAADVLRPAAGARRGRPVRRPRPQRAGRMTGVAVLGARGRMGSEVVRAVEAADDLRAGARARRGRRARPVRRRRRRRLHPPGAVMGNLEACIAAGVHAVVGTTGFTDERLDRLRELLGGGPTGVLVAPNFGVAAVLMMRFAATRRALLRLGRDRRAAPPGQGRRAERHRAAHRRARRAGARGHAADAGRHDAGPRRARGAPTSTACGCTPSGWPAWSRTRRCCSAGPARRSRCATTPTTGRRSCRACCSGCARSPRGRVSPWAWRPCSTCESGARREGPHHRGPARRRRRAAGRRTWRCARSTCIATGQLDGVLLGVGVLLLVVLGGRAAVRRGAVRAGHPAAR